MKKTQAMLYGAIGSVAPDIVMLYSKRWLRPELTFEPWQYLTVTVSYIALAAVVAAIFPMGEKPTPWKAFGVGVALPLLISALAKAVVPGPIEPRGLGTLPGTLGDLFALW